jgi:hypothetical protein
MVLADYINGDDECWPGNTRLAPEVAVSTRTLQSLLAKLEELEVIRRQARYRVQGRGRTSDLIRFSYEGLSKAFPLIDLAEKPAGRKRHLPEVPARVTGSGRHDQPEKSRTPSSFEPSREPPKEPAGAEAPAPRDELFEAVIEAWTGERWPVSLTEHSRSYANVAIRELRAIGATPAEVRRRGSHFLRTYERRPTPTALVKHWAALGAPPPTTAVGSSRSRVNGAAWLERRREEAAPV